MAMESLERPPIDNLDSAMVMSLVCDLGYRKPALIDPARMRGRFRDSRIARKGRIQFQRTGESVASARVLYRSKRPKSSGYSSEKKLTPTMASAPEREGREAGGGGGTVGVNSREVDAHEGGADDAADGEGFDLVKA